MARRPDARSPVSAAMVLGRCDCEDEEPRLKARAPGTGDESGSVVTTPRPGCYTALSVKSARRASVMTRDRISSRATVGVYPMSLLIFVRSGTRRGMSSNPAS